jgi:hypothetical protein
VAKVGTSNTDRTIIFKRLQCVFENNNLLTLHILGLKEKPHDEVPYL